MKTCTIVLAYIGSPSCTCMNTARVFILWIIVYYFSQFLRIIQTQNEDWIEHYHFCICLFVCLFSTLVFTNNFLQCSCFIFWRYQALLCVFRLGFVTNYLSEPLVRGFTTGAGVLVFTSQFPKLFGIKTTRRSGFAAMVYVSIQPVWHTIKPLSTKY